MAKTLLEWAKALFTPVAVAFLAYFAWQSRDILLTVLSSASIPNIVLAVIVWSLLHLIAPALAVLVLCACGSHVTWRVAFAIHASRLPARYLPGGIWHTVGRVMDFHERGVQVRHLTAFVALENGLAAAVTFALGGAVVFAYRGPDSVGAIAGLASLGGLLTLAILSAVVNRRVLRAADVISQSNYARAVGVVVLFWIGAAFAFIVYLAAFPATLGTLSLVEIGGNYLFAWGVGFVSVFAPQGIGVFEVVAGELLESPTGFMSSAVLIGGFRVVVFAADFTVWCAYRACFSRLANDSTSQCD